MPHIERRSGGGCGRADRARLLCCGCGVLTQDEGADDEAIHARAAVAVDRFCRRVHDWLVLVEAGVEQDGNAGTAREGRDEVVVDRVLLTRDGLQPAGPVDVRYRGQPLAPFGADVVDVKHKWRWVAVVEDLALTFGKHDRRKRAEPLATFDPRIQDVFHPGETGVREDRAVPERTRSPLHASL